MWKSLYGDGSENPESQGLLAEKNLIKMQTSIIQDQVASTAKEDLVRRIERL